MPMVGSRERGLWTEVSEGEREREREFFIEETEHLWIRRPCHGIGEDPFHNTLDLVSPNPCSSHACSIPCLQCELHMTAPAVTPSPAASTSVPSPPHACDNAPRVRATQEGPAVTIRAPSESLGCRRRRTKPDRAIGGRGKVPGTCCRAPLLSLRLLRMYTLCVCVCVCVCVCESEWLGG